MAEEAEGPEGSQGAADPAAMALGLAAASQGKADAYLDDQRRMLHLQMEEMRGEYRYKLSHFRLRRFSGWAKAAFEFSAGLLAVALVAGLAFTVWTAAHSDGLIIESFTVPPDLAATGQSGQVVATHLLDQINLVENASPTQSRPGRALSGGWSDDVKVEIPETGISLGELYRFLRRSLGHDAYLSGEVVHLPNGLAITVRIDGANSASYAGPETGLDGLVLKAAEHLVQVTQPGRYGAYLLNINPPRPDEAQAVLEQTAADNLQTALERSNAYNNLASIYSRFRADDRKANAMLRLAEKAEPGFAVPYLNQISSELNLGHAQAALDLVRPTLEVIRRTSDSYYPEAAIAMPAFISRSGASLLGDQIESIRQSRIGLESDRIVRLNGFRNSITLALAHQHDGGGVRDWLRQQPSGVSRPSETLQRVITLFQAQAALEQWPQVIAGEAAAEKAYAQVDSLDAAGRAATQLKPWLAVAKARSGDMAGAEAAIGATPGDCYDCVRARGSVASEARQWGRADYWFARAVHDAPSIPMAHEDWGRSLLARGKPDDAIAQFTAANKLGSHFADPLEGWGEALMAKNQSHLALAKFAEAEKYAPNWGRLHLKWGEALVYAGKPADAKAQFGRAAALDLTPSEKAELAKVGHV